MEEKSQLRVYNEMVEGLKCARGAATQLIHHTGHPVQFILLRDTLELLMSACNKVAPHNEFIKPKTIIL